MSLLQFDGIVDYHAHALAACEPVHPAYNSHAAALYADLIAVGWQPTAQEQPFIASELYELVRAAMRRVAPYATIGHRIHRFPVAVAGHSLLQSSAVPVVFPAHPPGAYSAGRQFGERAVPWPSLARMPPDCVREAYQAWCDARATTSLRKAGQRKPGTALGIVRGEIVAALDTKWPGVAAYVLAHGARSKLELTAVLAKHSGRRCARIAEQMHDIMGDPGRTAQELLRILLARDS